MLPESDIYMVTEGLKAPPNSPKFGRIDLPKGCLQMHFEMSELEDSLRDLARDIPASPPSCPRPDDCERFADNKWDDVEEVFIEDIEKFYIQDPKMPLYQTIDPRIKSKGFIRRQSRCTDLAGWVKAAILEEKDTDYDDNKFSPASESPSSVFDFNSSSDNDSDAGSKKTVTSNGTSSPRKRAKFFL